MSTTMVEIQGTETNWHNNNTVYTENPEIPEGWALVPESMLPLKNFPIGEVEAEEINGVMTLTKWTPEPDPEPPAPPEPEPDPEPTEFDKLQAQVLYTAVKTNTLLLEEDDDE